MFVYKDKKFTQEQVEQAAAKANLTVDEYLKANPDITIVIDNSEEAIKDRRNFNFEQKLIEENPIELEEIVITPEKAYDKSAYEEIEENRKIENQEAFNIIQSIVNANREAQGLDPQIPQQYDITKDPNQLNEIDEITQLTRLSKGEIEALERQQAEFESSATMDVKESIVNSVQNGINQLIGVDDRMKLIFGVLTDNKKIIGEANRELNRLNSYRGATIGFTDLSEREGMGKIEGGIAALVNAVTNFGASYVTAVGTAGIGLASDMVGGSIKDYNDQKAESLGIELGELYERGESEILVPSLLGSIGYSLEKAGIKGVNTYINALTLNAKKRLFLLLNAGGKEGGTEWVQTGIDKINEVLAQGKDLAYAVQAAWNEMTSKNGLESLLQGAFGGKAFAVSGRQFRTPTKPDDTTTPQDDTTPPEDGPDLREGTEPTQPPPPAPATAPVRDPNIADDGLSPVEDVTPPDGRQKIKIPNITPVRSVQEVSKIKASANLRTTSESGKILILMMNFSNLENSKYRKNLTPEDVALINDAQVKISDEIAAILKTNNTLVNSLSEDQITLVNNTANNIESLNSQKENVKNSDKFTDTDKNEIISSIDNQIQNENQVLYDIKNEAEIALQGVEVTAEDKSKKPAVTLQDVASEINIEAQTLDDMINKVANRATSRYFQGIPQNIREKAGLDRKTYLESAKAELLLIAQNYDSSRVDADGNQIAFDRYMANTGMQRLNSLAGRLGVESAEGPTTVSVESEQVQEIADPSTVETVESVTTETVTPTINVFGKGPEAEVLESQTVGAIQESELGRKIQSAETIEISDLNTLNEEVSAPILAEELNIPVEVITDPKLNINNQHNPSNIQRFILRNAQTVLGVLKANTNVEVVGSLKNPEVKIKVGGKPLKLPRKLLDLFFDKTDIRVGNNFQYKLKPNLTIKDIQMSVGILDGKVDPDFINRSGEAQTAKAILTLLSRVRTNAALEGITTGEVAGTILSATPEKVKTAVDRAIDYLKGIEGKYSGTLATGISPGPVAKALRVGLETFQSVYNKTKDFAKALSAYIKKVISGLKITNAEEKKIVADVLTEYVKVDNIDTVDLDGMINDLVEKLNINRGIAYEKVVYKNAEGITSPIFKIKGTQTEEGGAPDIQFEIAGQPFNIETKLETARYGSLTAKITSTGEIVFSKDFDFNTELENAINRNKANLDKYRERAEELGQDMNDFDKGIINKDIWEQLKGEGLLNDARANITLSADVISEIYAKKKPPVYYIQIKGKGLYYLSENPLNLPIPKLEGNVEIEVGLNTSGSIKGTNNRRFGIRIKPYKLTDIKETSDFSIDTKAGIESLLNTEAVKELAASAEAKQEVDNVLEDGKKALETPKVQKELEKINEEENSKDLSKDFNTIIEDNKGVKAEAVYSDIVAKRKGAGIGKFNFFLPPGAEDFKGLIYTFLGKGEKGEQQFEFFDNNLIKPYQQAIAQIERFRRSLALDYSALLKVSPEARVLLNKKIPGAEYSYDQAVRAYLMNKSGFDLTDTGLSKRDAKLLVDTIKNNPIMASFAEGLQLITKQDTWLKPNGGFDVQTIQSDLHRLTSGDGRKRFLENSGFMQNSGEIFSKDNLNKIEATYGRGVREAIEDMMYRMKNGTNRPSGTNRLTNQFNNWVNRSIGAIMFFNRKSALLQTISSINFINWSDNNPLMAAKAFANQKQYWSDFATIFNSPKLKERRRGLKGDINEAELASAVQGATNKAEAALSWLLKQGFLPTQMADSFAIATGGASFYRNRINTYKKQGLTDAEAEKKAFEDFSRISEESQQSADPSMISEQQASPLGRLILAFQNTPMQYTRLMKRAAQDLVAGRGDPKTHISKIIYYGAVQNFMFSALQNALFALIPGFDDEEEKEEEITNKEQAARNKNIRIANNMVDTVLRGSGIYGAIGATLKNTIIKFYQNEQKDPFAKDNADILLEAINLSPPIGSKLRKLNNALKTREFEKDVIEERGWEITRDGRLNLSPSYRVFGSTVEAVANVPLERIIAEIDALVEMTDSRNSAMERIALGLGWRTWDLGVRNEESDQIKVEVKERKKREKEEERKRKREEEKRLKEEARFEGLTNKEINALKREDQIKALTRQQQVDSLLKLGVSKKEIRSLRYEEDRIKKIIELNTK